MGVSPFPPLDYDHLERPKERGGRGMEQQSSRPCEGERLSGGDDPCLVTCLSV